LRFGRTLSVVTSPRPGRGRGVLRAARQRKEGRNPQSGQSAAMGPLPPPPPPPSPRVLHPPTPAASDPSRSVPASHCSVRYGSCSTSGVAPPYPLLTTLPLRAVSCYVDQEMHLDQPYVGIRELGLSMHASRFCIDPPEP